MGPSTGANFISRELDFHKKIDLSSMMFVCIDPLMYIMLGCYITRVNKSFLAPNNTQNSENSCFGAENDKTFLKLVKKQEYFAQIA